MSAKYIRELREAGYENLRPEQLVQMRIHGIDREYVRSISGKQGAGEKKR